MGGSMADIQSATAKIRRGKKIRQTEEEETTGYKYNGLPYSVGRTLLLTCQKNKNVTNFSCYNFDILNDFGNFWPKILHAHI